MELGVVAVHRRRTRGIRDESDDVAERFRDENIRAQGVVVAETAVPCRGLLVDRTPRMFSNRGGLGEWSPADAL